MVHIISGFFALGVLINLGPRIGKFGPNGEINNLQGHSVPMTIAGLMIIIIGFVGFMGACLLYNGTGAVGEHLRWPDDAFGVVVQPADELRRRNHRRLRGHP